jgi:hypothetical protein
MGGAFQMRITTMGLDIANNVFQVRGIDAHEKIVVRGNVPHFVEIEKRPLPRSMLSGVGLANKDAV